MGTPVNLKSVDAQSATGAGKSTMALGHYHIGLFVAARNLDEAADTLTVTLEGSPNGDDWSTIDTLGSADLSSDPSGGAMTGSVTLAGAYYPHLRARVSEFTDDASGDLEIDAWVMAGAWPEAGVRGGRDNG